jgi:hypothetical protein
MQAMIVSAKVEQLLLLIAIGSSSDLLGASFRRSENFPPVYWIRPLSASEK